jgi:hypothetical protein
MTGVLPLQLMYLSLLCIVLSPAMPAANSKAAAAAAAAAAANAAALAAAARPLGVDASTQVDDSDPDTSRQLQQPLPPAPLSTKVAAAALEASRQKLTQRVEGSITALSQLAAWLPPELLKDLQQQQQQHVEQQHGEGAGLAGEAGSKATGEAAAGVAAGDTAAAAAGTGVAGRDEVAAAAGKVGGGSGRGLPGSAARSVLLEEGRLVGSINELLGDLEGVWLDMVQQLEQAQVRGGVGWDGSQDNRGLR